MKKMKEEKPPARPPYYLPTAPTDITKEGLDHSHVWLRGTLHVLERIQHRKWMCAGCDAAGVSIEFVAKDPRLTGQ